MSKKVKKNRSPAPLSVEELKTRLAHAREEGRSQQALELSKQLYAAAATPVHRDLLLTVYLERARQLRGQGQARDARTVLENVINLAHGEAAWLEQAAVELAAAGESWRALQLLEKLPESSERPRVLAHAADEALQRGAAGRNLLPEALRTQFDLVLKAFQQLEAGQDEAAREALQGIGLTSPFLEWKVLLRGLQAYYQNDDARALENWSRLKPERLPARLAAPLRFQIDPAFQAAQPPQTQTALRRQADRLQGDGLVAPLRNLQPALHGLKHNRYEEPDLSPAFRMVDQVLPSLKQQAPQLVPRLACCFYWAIIQHGQPRDIDRYRRLFGAPADDPELTRLTALALEQRHILEDAHAVWQEYEQTLANHPAFPGDLGRRARALIWCRLGRNAALYLDEDEDFDDSPFGRPPRRKPKQLSPSAEECYRRSLELAPDQLETHQALFQFYQSQDKPGAAEKAGKKLLEHFPEHVPTLEALGDLDMAKNRYADALTCYQRALKANPLDRRLRSKLGTAHAYHARGRAEQGDYEAARAEYQSALTLSEGADRWDLNCKWAACEFKAGETEKAEELLRQAQTGPRLAVAYQMLIEAIRFKLPRPIKARFDKEFAEALAEPATPAAAVATLRTAAQHKAAGVKYYGQKTHEKKAVTYLGKVANDAFSEQELREVCSALVDLEEKRQAQRYIKLGERRFKRSPYFPLLYVRSLLPTGRKKRLPPYWQVMHPLARAEELAQGLPADDEQKKLLDEIERLRELLGVQGFGGMFGPDIFGDLFGGADDGPDEDFWDDEG